MKDPIVEEVRAVRAKIAEECGYDLHRILDHARDAASKIPGLKYVTTDELSFRRNRESSSKESQSNIPMPPPASVIANEARKARN